jgi:hypothetical protein
VSRPAGFLKASRKDILEVRIRDCVCDICRHLWIFVFVRDTQQVRIGIALDLQMFELYCCILDRMLFFGRVTPEKVTP